MTCQCPRTLESPTVKSVSIVGSLPTTTTDNFDGRQVTYQGRSYIWNGTSWKCDSDYLEIGGRNYFINSYNFDITQGIDGGGNFRELSTEGHVILNVLTSTYARDLGLNSQSSTVNEYFQIGETYIFFF